MSKQRHDERWLGIPEPMPAHCKESWQRYAGAALEALVTITAAESMKTGKGVPEWVTVQAAARFADAMVAEEKKRFP